jgi:hypothetical protein
VVRLVKDQQRSGTKFAEHVAKPGRVNLVRDQRVRQQEERTREPRVYGEAAFTPNGRKIFAIDDRECEPELGLKFILPLARHRWRRAHNDEIDAASEDELAQDQTGFDGLASADIVRDQQIDAR